MKLKYSCLRPTEKLKMSFPSLAMCYMNVFSEICRFYLLENYAIRKIHCWTK